MRFGFLCYDERVIMSGMHVRVRLPRARSAPRLSGCIDQLFFSRELPRAGVQRAFLGHRPDLDSGAVGQVGAAFGNGDRFFKVVHLQQQVAANGFLGLGKRSIDHRATLCRNNRRSVLKSSAIASLSTGFLHARSMKRTPSTNCRSSLVVIEAGTSGPNISRLIVT